MYLGIDVGGTNLKSGIIDSKGKLIYQLTVPTNAGKGKIYVLKSIGTLVGKALTNFKGIKSVGIGIGGVVSRKGIVTFAPGMPGWENVDIAKYLNKTYDIPIYVENDACIAALAEMLVGACKRETDFLMVSMGTGISGAIVYDRQIIKGANGGAGDLGHLIIDMKQTVTNQEQVYTTGILEGYVGKNKIAEYAKEQMSKYPNSILNKYEKLDPYFLSDAIMKGDKASGEIFKEIGKILGIGIASALNLLDLSLVVFGGGLAQSHQSLFNAAYETVKKRALPTVAEKLEFRFSKFAKEAGIIGAALLGKIHTEQSE